ncbi:MAG: radical SAM protein [Thermoprotei archaeon]|nr:radical SAM protein [Thermoprotei archaeon]
MIPLSVMVTGRGTVSFKIKGPYGRGSPSRFTSEFKPITFWHLTFKCNLYCMHCYISASPFGRPGELSESEALKVADEIVELEIPLVVLSGGEPLVRRDFPNIALRLVDGGVKVSLSTNGTLITRDVANMLAKLNISYVGISLDSLIPEVHDKFRGLVGAYRRAIEGIKNSVEAGLDVGLRMTITRFNVDEAPKLIDLALNLGVKRISYYLIDITGRAREHMELLPTGAQLRNLLDTLIERSKETGGNPEILVVRGNFAGIYVADRMAGNMQEFGDYLKMISAQGDCGRKTISIYPDGKVKPCQFLEWIDIGDLRVQKLREILNPENPLLKPFLELHKHLKGPKCSKCPFKEMCGGGSRGRALAATGDFWGDDPLCFIDGPALAAKWYVNYKE